MCGMKAKAVSVIHILWVTNYVVMQGCYRDYWVSQSQYQAEISSCRIKKVGIVFLWKHLISLTLSASHQINRLPPTVFVLAALLHTYLQCISWYIMSITPSRLS